MKLMTAKQFFVYGARPSGVRPTPSDWVEDACRTTVFGWPCLNGCAGSALRDPLIEVVRGGKDDIRRLLGDHVDRGDDEEPNARKTPATITEALRPGDPETAGEHAAGLPVDRHGQEAA